MNPLQKIYYSIFTTVLLLVLSGMIPNHKVHAQLGDTGEILRSGAEDASVLFENYMKPFGAGFGADLNSGWVNSARPYRTLGFDIRVNFNVAIAPAADEVFNIAALQLNRIQILEGDPETSTFTGPDDSGPLMGFQETFTDPQSGETITVEQPLFNMPQGIGYPYVPAPMVQASVGIIKDTELSLRYLPKFELPGDADIGLFGFGVKHGLNQWIPGGGVLPVDLSVQGGFTKLNTSVGFSVDPEYDEEYTEAPDPSISWDGQKAEMDVNAFTANLLVGKNLPIVAFFGGVGFQTSTFSLSTPGNYPVIVRNEAFESDPLNEKPFRVTAVDKPIDIEIDGENTFHALAGFRVRLGFLAVSASYQLAKYPVASLGVGVSFR